MQMSHKGVTAMPNIDADAHVLESPQTWSYLEDSEKHLLPMIVSQSFGNERRNRAGVVMRDFWAVDGGMHLKDSNVGEDAPRESREMEDVGARLAHMDELGVDIQVLYPTLFLRPVTRTIESEYALCRSYNRWLADIWRQGDGRLRWVAKPPLMSPADKIRDELIFAKEHGACGIFMRGLECELPLADANFFPLYEIASELDLAVCVHSANGSFTHHGFFVRDTTFTMFKLATVGAFHSLLEKEVPAKFPDVRWAFVEVSAQWIPYVLVDLHDRFRRLGEEFAESPLKTNNMYVACEVTDDLPYVLKYAGEDNLMIGTDYGHNDPSSELNAIRMLRKDERIDDTVRQKILEDNAKVLYGLT